MPLKMDLPRGSRPSRRGRQMPSVRAVLGLAPLLGLLLCVSAAEAQDWAKAMFDQTSYDFGVVARGAKVEHRFIVENVYEEEAHIKSASSSCGCSTPQIINPYLKTWEKGAILVTVDTRAFLGRKDATITVVFDKPFDAQVQLHVHTYIRSDIVVQPGGALFGSVVQGAGAKQELAVDYAGRDDWRILQIESSNPAIEAHATETKRSPGRVGYNLSVELRPDAPPGYLRDQLVLVTNDFDARAARVPVAIEGLVVAALSVRPSPLMMGATEVGRPVTRNLVVQGRLPFRITRVQSSDERFQCKTSTETKAAHVLPVTFLAKEGKGTVDAKLHIETDLTGVNSVDVNVSVQVAAPAGTAKP
jgi:hypothetical protein